MTDDKPNTLSLILKLLDDADGKFLELGCALMKLKAEQPDAFTLVVNLPQLGRRRGYYFLDIGVAFGDKPFLHQRIKRIGWTKAATIAKHADAANFEDLLELAENLTAFALRTFLKKGPSALGGRLLAFALDGAEYAAVTETLKLHGAYETANGLHDKEAALLVALSIVK